MTRLPLALLVTLGVAVASASAAPPSVVPGWPRSADAGTLLPGPGGGVVVVSLGEVGSRHPTDDNPHVVSAYRRDGRLLWRNRRIPGCGNCWDGPQPPELQPNGAYGPIGPEGSDFWAVDHRGREVAGCSGAVAGDGTCHFVRWTFDAAALPRVRFFPALVARRSTGADAWSTAVDVSRPFAPDAPPMVVRGAGRVYLAIEAGSEPGTGAEQPGRLAAVDPATGRILWTREGPERILTALSDGVLVAHMGGMAAVDADGEERWSRPLANASSV